MVALLQEAVKVPGFFLLLPLPPTWSKVAGPPEPHSSRREGERGEGKAEASFFPVRIWPGVALTTWLHFTGQKFSPMKGKVKYVALILGVHVPQ